MYTTSLERDIRRKVVKSSTSKGRNMRAVTRRAKDGEKIAVEFIDFTIITTDKVVVADVIAQEKCI